MGYDGIFSHVIAGGEVVVSDSINSDTIVKKFHLESGIEKFFRLFTWVSIPTYIIFFPLGFFYFLKNKKSDNIQLLVLGIVSLIPAFYAASRGIEDTRYYFIFFPLFIIFSLYFLQRITSRWKVKYAKLVFVAFVIISSFIFLDFKDDIDYKSEIFLVVKENFSELQVINDIHPYSPYFRVMPLHLNDNFPIERKNVDQDIIILKIDDFDSIYELFESDEGKKITHLIIDDSSSRKDFLKDLFKNEGKYSFLVKVYDSTEHSIKHHVKIFKYDPQKFINLNEKEVK